MVEGFLSQLDPGERDDLEKLGTARRYRRGDVLFHQGDDAGAVVVLIDGHVKAVMMNDGREVILAFPGPGELLGELSAVDGEPRSGTVRAVDDVEALVIPGSAFRAFLERRPRVALVLLRSVAARLREADRQRVDYAINDVVVRVASRLVDLCDRYGAEDEAGIDIGLAITQDSWPRGRARPARPSPRRWRSCARSAGSRPSGGGSSCWTWPRCAATRPDTASARACRSTRPARGRWRCDAARPPIASDHRNAPDRQGAGGHQEATMFDHSRLVRLITVALASCAVTWALAAGASARPDAGATTTDQSSAPAFKSAPGDTNKAPSATTQAPAFQPPPGTPPRRRTRCRSQRVLNGIDNKRPRRRPSTRRTTPAPSP